MPSLNVRDEIPRTRAFRYHRSDRVRTTVGDPMERARSKSLPALIAAVLALLLFATAACKSSSSNADSGSPKPAGAGVTATSTAAGTASSDTRICGTPPCMRFVSRSETKTVADTAGAHPLLSAVALHVVVGLLCGGILCVLGEGVGVSYIGDAAKQAVANHECLRVRILPNGREWHLVDVTPSNQSPYCTD
jgi:predicted RNA-binding Zn ribbon-like protein